MNFKLTKRKVIISLIITLIWYIIIFYLKLISLCGGIPFCENNFRYLIPLPMCPSCISLFEAIKLDLLLFGIPFIITYLILSLKEKKNNSK